MPQLSAQQARSLSAAPYTQPELDSLFATVDLKIEAAAALRRFYVDVRVGDRELPLMAQWLQAAGYTIELSPPEIEIAAPIRPENGEGVNVRIGWQGFQFRALPATIVRGGTLTFQLDTQGVDDGIELIWQNVGTSISDDFIDTVNQGLATVGGDFTAIVRATLPSATVGRTVQLAIFLDFDGQLQQVALSTPVTITA